jgi:hypothetical protein
VWVILNKVVMQAKGMKGLWFVEKARRDYSFLTREKDTAELWHWSFGHAGFENLAKLAEGELAVGVKVGAGEFRARIDNSGRNSACLINGKVLPVILLDYGAESVITGRAGARQMGLRPSMMDLGAVALRVADGGTTKACVHLFPDLQPELLATLPTEFATSDS